MYIIEKILMNNLEKFDLLNKKFTIGFSGGSDSTSLIIALTELKKNGTTLNFDAFHVNYGLRKDADNDQRFVESLCKKLKVKLTKVNLKKQNLLPKSPSEENLRNIRYKLISSHILKNDSYCLITGHNLNDHVETFLMKLARGAGMKGMEGLKYFSIINKFNDLKIFRPFIKIKKNDLLNYCLTNEISPINDISNYDNKYSRNRIRNNVVPEMEKLNSDFLNTINRTTNIIKEINIYHNKLIEEKIKKIKLIENENLISMDRSKFNMLDEVERKLILKSKCESFSESIFIEYKHLNIIIKKCSSQIKNFSLDMPGPIIIKGNKDSLVIKISRIK
tara:strand:+ start:1010 stop:2011 length:1002 start_codon:yes stop_codon:yes gene_type:complete